MERLRNVYIARVMEDFIDNSRNGISLTVYDDELEQLLKICSREELEILIRPASQEGE